MSENTARRLSWSIALMSIVVMMVGLALGIIARVALDGRLTTFSHQYFTPVLTFTCGVVGALVASRHPRNVIGWIFCAIGLLSALNMLSVGYKLYDELAVPRGSLPGTRFASWLDQWLWILTVLLPITFLLLLFPNGQLISRRWRPVAWATTLGIGVYVLGIAFHPGPVEWMGLASNPFGIRNSADIIDFLLTLAAPLLAIGILGSIAAVIVRYRRATGIERAQLKWLTFAGIIVIAANILGGIPWWLWPDNAMVEELYIVITNATIVNIVIATGIAILRYRLWDIDLVINRTLVYTLLTATVIAVYVVIVGILGGLFQSSAHPSIGLVGTGVVAILFQPLRLRVQRGVNRLMFGERDEPYTLLKRLSQRLEVVVAPQAVLPIIVETVAQALKLPYAAIVLRGGEQESLAAEYRRSASAEGKTPTVTETLPLVYQTETVGHLLLAPRAPGEHFTRTDRQLLETIARQAGIAAYNVRLTQDLQHSRERLVITREEERRRLRRDLHDGLGPALASMAFKLDAIHNRCDRDPEAVQKLTTEMKSQLQEALKDIRRIAYDLRPPALDELGLVGALKQHLVSHNQAQGLQITLEVPEALPPLTAATEVAAYRIALEALTNASRHAGAQHCCIRLSVADDIRLEVTDDGRGLPDGLRTGIGFTSMRERAEELGGTCFIHTIPQGGTSVMARLPLLSHDNAHPKGFQWNQFTS